MTQPSLENQVKITCQYSSKPIPEDDMQKLLEIAVDYRKVKNYVYNRYGGISALLKLYPGYTVQNEMTDSGVRAELDMPSVYFYLAVFDALKDIKTQWARTKSAVQQAVKQNEAFREQDRHFIRFVLKTDDMLSAILNQKEITSQVESIEQMYRELAKEVNEDKLCKYLRRQVRKHHKRLHTDKADSFLATERAYRYKNHGIWISTKEKRKRVFIPLTDHNTYIRQIRVMLYPEEARVEIKVPITIKIKWSKDNTKKLGIALGVHTMITTAEGNVYGEELGNYLRKKADWIREHHERFLKQTKRDTNPIGRKKYQEQKNRMDAGLHTYINQELNRFLKTEKPIEIYMAKLPPNSYGGNYKSDNYMTTIWERGFIRRRLQQKCMEQGILIKEVYGKDIGRTCCVCGGLGKKDKTVFCCGSCQNSMPDKVNVAKNVYRRGIDDKDHKQVLLDKQ